MLARFVNLRIVSSWSTNWTQDGAAKRGICNKGAGVECRGLIIPQVCGRAVPESRRQGFVDGRFEREDRRGALLRFLRIESLKARDTLLQPRRCDAASVRRSGLEPWAWEVGQNDGPCEYRQSTCNESLPRGIHLIGKHSPLFFPSGY